MSAVPPLPTRPARQSPLTVLSRTLLPVAVFAGLIAVVAEPLTKLAGRLPLAEPLTRLLAWLVADLVLGIVLLRLIEGVRDARSGGVTAGRG